MKAIWNDTVIAESDDTVVVEGNHYFPIDSVRADLLEHDDHGLPLEGHGALPHACGRRRLQRRRRLVLPDPEGCSEGDH